MKWMQSLVVEATELCGWLSGWLDGWLNSGDRDQQEGQIMEECWRKPLTINDLLQYSVGGSQLPTPVRYPRNSPAHLPKNRRKDTKRGSLFRI